MSRWLRCSLEFLSSLYPRKAMQRSLRPLKHLQKSLGIINTLPWPSALRMSLLKSGLN